jgi:hypothetical protein
VRLNLPPANLTPLPITPAPKDFERASLPLPGAINRACLGGGGRFLLLVVPSQRQLAVLDFSERKIVKYLPLPGDKCLVAAGLEKFVVAHPQENLLQRWSLLKLEKEQTVPSPVAIGAMCLGHASHGPILAAAGNTMQFLSLETLEPLPVPTLNKRVLGVGSFLQASANGRHFGMREGVAGSEPHTGTVLSLDEQGVRQKQQWPFGGSVLAPSPDGRFLYALGGVFDPELKKVSPASIGGNYPHIPAAHGGYYLRLEPPMGLPGKKYIGKKVSFFFQGGFTPLAQLDNLEGIVQEQIAYGTNRDTLTPTERVFFIPAAKLLATIPVSNDRVELLRFDPEEAMDRAGIDYLLVTSDPPAVAQRGKPFAYAPVVRSRKGGVKLKLESGPPGMKLGGAGAEELVWDVPADMADRTTSVILTVSDASGRELFHTFTLSLVDPPVPIP